MKASENLRFTLIQPDMMWENKAANLDHYGRLISNIVGHKEVVVLPEMFPTGFSMASERLAEPMEGDTIQWMRDTAHAHRIILVGSLMIKEEEHYFNRLVWMQPDGQYSTYDKRHLFAYAQEHQHFSPGQRKLVTQVKGWRICPLVCYDLRFPVWSRYAAGAEYDLLLYVANWPQRRSLAWKTLLQARAIENQAYSIGVNRIGEDANGIIYVGESSVFDPLGTQLWQAGADEAVHTIDLSYAALQEARNHYPFLKDADKFLLQS